MNKAQRHYEETVLVAAEPAELFTYIDGGANLSKMGIYMAITDIFKKTAKKLDEAKDPICGMKVDLETAKFKSTYQGKVYGFCSEECKKTFDKNPFQYADPNC